MSVALASRPLKDTLQLETNRRQRRHVAPHAAAQMPPARQRSRQTLPRKDILDIESR